MMHQRYKLAQSWVTGVVSVFLVMFISACGFHLRGTAQLPFETLYINVTGNSEFVATLSRYIQFGTNTKIVTNPQEAQASFSIISESRNREQLSLDERGRVREYTLFYDVSFKVVSNKGVQLVPPSTIRLQRSLRNNDSELLAQEFEENMQFQDMRNEAIRRIINRIQNTVNVAQ